MRIPGIIIAAFALVGMLSAQTVAPSMARTVSLAKEIEYQPTFFLRSDCAQDGSFLLPINGHFSDTGQRLLRVGTDGTLQARYDAEAAAGLGQIRVTDYALGANGEVHLLAHKISKLEFKRRGNGSIESFSESYEPALWMISFDAKGDFLGKREYPDPPAPAREGLVALPSGAVFITGVKGTRPAPTPSRRLPVGKRPRPMPLYAYFTTPGAERKYVELPSVEDGFKPASRLTDVPLMNGHEIWIARLGSEGSPSSLFVLRPDGALERSVRLELPAGAQPGAPRSWGDRLLVTLYSSRTHRVRGSRFVELDAHTGKLLADYSFATRGVEAVCNAKYGPVFLDAPKRMLGFVDPTR